MSDFDDLFKSRLEGHEVDVPDDMWSRIQDAQSPEDTRKPIFLYWKVGIAAILLITFISVPFLYTSENTSTLASSSTKDVPADSLLSGKFKTTGSSTNGHFIASDDISSTEAKELVDVLPSKINSSADVNIENKSDQRKEDIIKFSIVNILDIHTNQLNKEITTNSEEKNSSVLSNGIVYNFIKREIKPTSNLTTLGLIPFNEKEITYNVLLPDYAKKCPKFGTSLHGYFSVEAYHSSDYNLKSFTTDDEEFNSYIDIRNETESTVYSFSNGIRFKWWNNSGLGLGVGLERSVIKETFSFIEQDAREVKILISIDTLFNTDGSYTTSTDTTRIEIAGIRTNRINNSYTSIDLPLHLSYQMEVGRWAIGLSGGININLMFDQKGRILNFDNKPAWISSGSQNELDIYRAKSGLKFDGAITVIFHLTPSIDIMAEPYFKYNPNSLTRENHPLKHYNNTMGIRTGLRYNFGF